MLTLGKMLGTYSCLELCVLLCFYNGIANTVNDIAGTINSISQYHCSITLCFNSVLKVLMDFQQCLFCFTDFCEPLVCILLFSL